MSSQPQVDTDSFHPLLEPAHSQRDKISLAIHASMPD